MKKKHLLLALAVTASAAMVACGDDDKNEPLIVPDSYVQAMETRYPEATNVEWEREGIYYVAEYSKPQQEIDVWFGPKAEWAMTKTDYGKNLLFLPPVVSDAFAEGEYGYHTVDDVAFYERTDANFYVIEVEKAGTPDMDLYYKPDGTMIKAVRSADITPTTPL